MTAIKRIKTGRQLIASKKTKNLKFNRFISTAPRIIIWLICFFVNIVCEIKKSFSNAQHFSNPRAA
jgi:hypothetical protein